MRLLDEGQSESKETARTSGERTSGWHKSGRQEWVARAGAGVGAGEDGEHVVLGA